MTPFERVTRIPDPDVTPEAVAAATGMDLEKMRESFREIEREAAESTYWRNDLYQVVERWLDDDEHGFGGVQVVHLSIKRIDREPIHDWRHLQEIKNALVGEQHEAIELYPAASRLVDNANQYHLWAFLPCGDEDVEPRVPLGWKSRVVSGGIPGSRVKQRPFSLDDLVQGPTESLHVKLSALSEKAKHDPKRSRAENQQQLLNFAVAVLDILHPRKEKRNASGS